MKKGDFYYDPEIDRILEYVDCISVLGESGKGDIAVYSYYRFSFIKFGIVDEEWMTNMSKECFDELIPLENL